MRTRLCALALLVVVSGGPLASMARGDGDPGSDVLVSQNLFIAADANASVKQQLQVGGLLQQAARAGFPIRVAVISGPDDLGAVTALWNKPRAYARFLGIELSLAYRQRLLVVMPDGFGFYWSGHDSAPAYRVLGTAAVRTGGAGLLDAAGAAVARLAAAAHVKLAFTAHPAIGTRAAAPATGSAGAGAAVPTTGAGTSATPSNTESDTAIAAVVVGLGLLALASLAVRLALRRRGRSGPGSAGESTQRPRARTNRLRWAVPGFAALATVVVGAVAVLALGRGASQSEAHALATNPYLDPGTPMARAAPDFTLDDQFGQPVSLRSFTGKVVILAFNDSECTTICPLTTTAMLDAKRQLGAAGSQVQLLGIDANPKATSIEDVSSYSQLHGMQHQWHFLTGSLSQLKAVWKAYGIEAEIQRGLIAHTPALFVIDPQGRLRKLYVTQQSYTAVGQLGQLLAREASSLLPSHPRVDSSLSYAQIPGISPSITAALPKAGGGTVTLGPGSSPRLYLFFATWDKEVTSLAGQLQALNAYQSTAHASGLPSLTAVDEGSVEPSAAALPQFLSSLTRPLTYPVAIDQTGRVADGYEVQGEPWLVLTSATGHILWYDQVYGSGWLSHSGLDRAVRAALTQAPQGPANAAAAQRELVGSPAPLAALHQQARRLLGSTSALQVRIKGLRGYPIVINAWASWCIPCRSEFGLFANASAHYGRRVAFLGADTSDSPSDAQSFLAQHPVSYPSYQSTEPQLQSLLPGGLEGLPTTIYINRTGKVVDVHTGQYESQGTLDGDIDTYALAG
jgi:cytochrome oxidase Cu insertion factor (SCO1/SenC/PrrC family)/thiol-disulfide isomerase/thioredoxin